MSYLSLQGLSINKKALTVSGKSSSSNVWDWNDKRIWNSFKKDFNSIAELEDFLVSLANDILGGSARLAKSHILNKRIAYLRQEGLLKEVGSHSVKWENVDPTPLAKSILSGDAPLALNTYSIEGPLYGVRATTRQYKLVQKNKATLFYDKSEAEKALIQLAIWENPYQLSVVEKTITK